VAILSTFLVTLSSCDFPYSEKYHPELDTSDLLVNEKIVKYQFLIGALLWVVSIGRFDVMIAVHCHHSKLLLNKVIWIGSSAYIDIWPR